MVAFQKIGTPVSPTAVYEPRPAPPKVERPDLKPEPKMPTTRPSEPGVANPGLP